MTTQYVFFEKDNFLDLDEMAILFWLKFIYQKKMFSMDEIAPATNTPISKIRTAIRRLISKGYVFYATRAEGAYIPNNASKRTNIANLKIYTWADTRTIYSASAKHELIAK